MTIAFFDLSRPAQARLSAMRDAFAAHAANYPHCPEHARPKSWRDLRGTNYASVDAYHGTLSRGFNGAGRSSSPVWYSHAGPSFRNERFADECDGRSRLRGYYTDADGDAIARGIVASLPHGRFIAGYHWSDNGERVYFPALFDDESDAASMADEHARVFAESAQEDARRYDDVAEREHAESLAADSARLAIAARNVSDEHRAIAIDSIAMLREASSALDTARAAYCRG